MPTETGIGKRIKGLNKGITPEEYLRTMRQETTLPGFDSELARIILNPIHYRKTPEIIHTEFILAKEEKRIILEIFYNSVRLEIAFHRGTQLHLSDAPVDARESIQKFIFFNTRRTIKETLYKRDAVKIVWDDNNYLWIFKSGNLHLCWAGMTLET